MKYSFLSRLPKIKYYPTWLNGSGKGGRKVWRVAVTFLNDKARPYVEPLAKELEAVMFLPMGVSKRGEWNPCLIASSVNGGTWISWCIP